MAKQEASCETSDEAMSKVFSAPFPLRMTTSPALGAWTRASFTERHFLHYCPGFPHLKHSPVGLQGGHRAVFESCYPVSLLSRLLPRWSTLSSSGLLLLLNTLGFIFTIWLMGIWGPMARF